MYLFEDYQRVVARYPNGGYVLQTYKNEPKVYVVMNAINGILYQVPHVRFCPITGEVFSIKLIDLNWPKGTKLVSYVKTELPVPKSWKLGELIFTVN